MTAIDTAVGEKKKFLEVKECTHYVLAIIIDFIYGTEIPDDLTQETGESLLVMADLYLMEDLEEAVSIALAKHLSLDNVLEVFQLGEKHTAQKLKDLCSDFLIANKDCLEIATEILGTNLQEKFLKRADFGTEQEYIAYKRITIKPNMIVRCTNIRSPLYGTIGRVVACKGNGELEVKSQIGVVDGALENMELVAPPICMEIFTNN